MSANCDADLKVVGVDHLLDDPAWQTAHGDVRVVVP